MNTPHPDVKMTDKNIDIQVILVIILNLSAKPPNKLAKFAKWKQKLKTEQY